MQFRLSTLFLLFVVLWSSLAVFGADWGIVVFVAAVVVAVFVQKVEKAAVESIPWMTIIIVICCLLALIGLLLPAVQSAREAAPRNQCANNLHAINLALLCYETTNGCFPPAYIADKNGRPMHSWRVLILPYLDERALYKQYSFKEPWDGPNNKKLLAVRPRVYACPADTDAQAAGSSLTSYVAVVGRNAAWQGEKSQRLRDFSGAGTTMTIMLVETTNAGIPWTKPEDLSLDAVEAASPEPCTVTASSHHGDYQGFFYSQRHFYGVNAAFADGHQQFLPSGCLAPKVLPTFFEIGGATDEAYEKAESTFYSPPGWDDKPHLNWTNCLALLVWLASVGLLMFRAVRSRKTLVVKGVAERAGEGTTNEHEQTRMKDEE